MNFNIFLLSFCFFFPVLYFLSFLLLPFSVSQAPFLTLQLPYLFTMFSLQITSSRHIFPSWFRAPPRPCKFPRNANDPVLLILFNFHPFHTHPYIHPHIAKTLKLCEVLKLKQMQLSSFSWAVERPCTWLILDWMFCIDDIIMWIQKHISYLIDLMIKIKLHFIFRQPEQ